MAPLRAAVLFLAILSSGIAHAAPIDDLASPDQATRDRAAATLRETFQPTPESKWAPLLKKLRYGMTRGEMDKLIDDRSSLKLPGLRFNDWPTSYQSYRLDGEWVLIFEMGMSNETRSDTDTLLNYKLRSALEYIEIKPADNFTGTHVLYYINGQKRYETSYKDGVPFGQKITYHPDGLKAVLEHFVAGRKEGEEIAYHPSGEVFYRGQTDSIGAWIMAYAEYYPSGKILRQCQTGKSGLVWTSYDENGQIIPPEKNPDHRTSRPSPPSPDQVIKTINETFFRQAGLEIYDFRLRDLELHVRIRTLDGLGAITLHYSALSSIEDAKEEYRFVSKTIAAGLRPSPFSIGDETTWASYRGTSTLIIRQALTVFSLSGNSRISGDQLAEVARQLIEHEAQLTPLFQNMETYR